jgi:hypothetical protein
MERVRRFFLAMIFADKLTLQGAEKLLPKAAELVAGAASASSLSSTPPPPEAASASSLSSTPPPPGAVAEPPLSRTALDAPLSTMPPPPSRARNRDLTRGRRACSPHYASSPRARSRAAAAADDIAERKDSGGCEEKTRGCAADGGTARNVRYTVGASRVGHRRRRAGARIDDSRRADRNPPELALLTHSVFLRLVVIVSCLLLC